MKKRLGDYAKTGAARLVTIDKRGRVVKAHDARRRKDEWPFQRATAFESPAAARAVASELRRTGRAPPKMRRHGSVLTRVYADTDPWIGEIARRIKKQRRLRHGRTR